MPETVEPAFEAPSAWGHAAMPPSYYNNIYKPVPGVNSLVVNRFLPETVRYCTECDTIQLVPIHFLRIRIYPVASVNGPQKAGGIEWELQLGILSRWSGYLHNCATWSVPHEWRLFCCLVFPPTIDRRCCLLWWHTSGCGRLWPCMILSSRVES